VFYFVALFSLLLESIKQLLFASTQFLEAVGDVRACLGRFLGSFFCSAEVAVTVWYQQYVNSFCSAWQ